MQNLESDSKAYALHLEQRSGFTCKFICKDGRRLALHYSDLVKIEYNPDLKGILLEYVGDRVTILGINLMELFDMLCEHKVGTITETHVAEHMITYTVDKDRCYVSEIMFEIKI